jgi:NADH:ubiquinone oxidoreductase subunit
MLDSAMADNEDGLLDRARIYRRLAEAEVIPGSWFCHVREAVREEMCEAAEWLRDALRGAYREGEVRSDGRALCECLATMLDIAGQIKSAAA